MKWGDKYGSDYVNRLYQMVKRNITPPFKFVCYTDNKVGIDSNIEVYDMPRFDAAHLQTKGAYQKKTLCRSGLEPFKDGERFLFLDLDIVIMKNIDCFFEYLPNEDFIICYNWTRGNGKIGNSSVTMFRSGSLDYIISDLEKDFINYQNKFGTASQEYLSSKVIEKFGKLNFWPEEWCKSFQYHCLPNRLLRLFFTSRKPPEQTRILLFHGRVNPPDAIQGIWPGDFAWWKKWYKSLRPVPWLKEFWEN